MEELKPCPFCGSQPRVMDGTGRMWPPFQVKCVGRIGEQPCQAEVWPSDTREEAIAAWNTRTKAPATEQPVERTCKTCDGLGWYADRDPNSPYGEPIQVQCYDCPQEVGMEKCCCGHKGCSTYWLTGIGNFRQGSGFEKEEAERIVAALNAPMREYSNQWLPLSEMPNGNQLWLIACPTYYYDEPDYSIHLGGKVTALEIERTRPNYADGRIKYFAPIPTIKQLPLPKSPDIQRRGSDV